MCPQHAGKMQMKSGPKMELYHEYLTGVDVSLTLPEQVNLLGIA